MKSYASKVFTIMLVSCASPRLLDAASPLIARQSIGVKERRITGAIVLPIDKENQNTYFTPTFIVKSLEVYGLVSCQLKKEHSEVVATYDWPVRTFKSHMEYILNGAKLMNVLGLILYRYDVENKAYAQVGVYHFLPDQKPKGRDWLLPSYFDNVESADMRAAL